MDNTIIEALQQLDPAATSYEEWIKVGQALHKEGYDCTVWDSWSMADPRYHEGECARKWAGFGKTNNTEVGAGTLVDIAKAHGYNPTVDMMQPLGWDDEISTDWEPNEGGSFVQDKAWLDVESEENQLHDVTDGWNDTGSIDELTRYIQALFQPEDKVGFVFDAYYREEDDKWSPKNHGVTFRAGELLEKLQKAKDKDGDITRVIFTYKKEGGAWIRPNPLDGNGYGNKNVAAFRYALLESDSMPIPQQIAIIREMQLPVKMLVYSGGKSVHAIVHIDAANEKEYRQRVDKLYAECKKNKFIPDEQNKNASRLSRMPGVWRGEKKQYIIDENIGQPSWQAWEDFLADIQDTLPDIEDLNTVLDAPHEPAPELIEGTLRQGHKMLIAGPSKAGKSFLLMELAVAISAGRSWLGKHCRKGEVLYVNLEIDQNSFLCRFDEIYKKCGIDRKKSEKIHIWTLRGKTPSLDVLTPRLIRRIRDKKLAAIIIDPIYKIITGDENNARDMSKFCNFFDTIAAETGASVIYVHHHSKGSQTGKRSMDRASGSGVFARDPDALLDMIELERKEDDGERSPLRIESTLREFSSWKPINLWFDFPLHFLDEKDELRYRQALDPLSTVNERKAERKEDAKSDAIRAYEELTDWDPDGENKVKISDIAAKIGKSEKTVKSYFKEMEGEFEMIYGGNEKGSKSYIRRKKG